MSMEEIYDSLARSFIAEGNYKPSHCDVRCSVNDYQDSLKKDGQKVNHGYSQDRAHVRVCNLIKKYRTQ